MPKLDERDKTPRVLTSLNLPEKTRAELASTIGMYGIRSMTDAVIAASALLVKTLKPQRQRTKP